MKDTLIDEQVLRDKELEVIEPKFICENCQDTGLVEKIEWTDTDTSYPKYYKCNCQE